jgi:regulator of sigma E protease
VALRRGLKVEAFAIGFGPRILSWRRNNVEYSWRAIPLGGFVRLPQIENPKALEGNAQNAALPAVTPFSKILVVLAGPLMNIVFAFSIASLLYVVGLPVAVDPPIIGYVDPSSPEGRIGIAVGDRILSVDGKDVASWDDAQMAAVMACTNPIAVVIRHGTEIAHYQLTATVNKDLNLKYLNLYRSNLIARS